MSAVLDSVRAIDLFISDPAHISAEIEDMVRAGRNAEHLATYMRGRIATASTENSKPTHAVTTRALVLWLNREIAKADAALAADRADVGGFGVCPHCLQVRTESTDECGGEGEGICAEYSAAIDAGREQHDDRASHRRSCWFCDQPWGKCLCAWPHEGDPDYGRDGFPHSDMIIFQPNVSECGRFYVNPEAYYGEAFKRWRRSL